MRALPALLLLAVSSTVCSRASAWTVGSGMTRPCHEKITGAAYSDSVLEAAGRNIVLPSDEVWRRLSEYLLEKLPVDRDSLSDRQRYMLVSLMVGVRAPDTDGHALTNIENLHNLHGDPSAEGQYKHGLRGPNDDYDRGNVTAVNGTRTEILDVLAQGKAYVQLPPEDRNIHAPFYLDYYGEIQVSVYAPLFYMGQALHTFQDTFSHELRDKHDGYHSVVHVMNYIDAIGTDFDERRDGLAHSDAMDDCKRADMQPIVKAVSEASTEFLGAVYAQYTKGDSTKMEHVLDAWLTLKPGCTFDNDFCDNAQGLAIARIDPTGPYLEGFIECTTVGARGSASGNGAGIAALTLVAGAVALRRGRRSRRQRG